MLAIEIPGEIGGTDDGSRPNRLEIVAVERDVERTLRHGRPFTTLNHFHDAIGELNSTALNTDDDQVLSAFVDLDDFDRHALEGALDGPGVEDRRVFRGHRCTIWRCMSAN